MGGWILLYRKLLKWEWYSNSAVKGVFIHLLLTANHEDGRWQGIEIKRGETVISLSKLASATGLGIKQVRNALQKLEETGEIERQRAKQYTRIKLLNYCTYQSFDYSEGQSRGTAWARQGQAKGTKGATNNNDNNINNDNNENKIYGTFHNVSLSDEEYDELSSLGLTPLIDELSVYMASTGKKYASHYATVISWSEKRRNDNKLKPYRKALSCAPSFDIREIERRALYDDNYDI